VSKLQPVELRHDPFSLTVGGKEVPEVRRVVYDSGYPDDVPRLYIEVNGRGQAISTADVHVQIVPLPGFEIVEREEDGHKVYTCREVDRQIEADALRLMTAIAEAQAARES
jgi:hypothetical protein